MGEPDMVTQGCSVSEAASSGVTPVVRHVPRPSRTMTERPSTASRLGQRRRPVPGLAEHGGTGEACRQVGGDRAEQPGQRDRPGQLVPGVLPDAVGDPHVEAELAEDVGHRVVDGAHRGGRDHGARPVAEVDEHPVAEGPPQPGPPGQQPELPGVRGQDVVAGGRRRGAEAVEGRGVAVGVKRLAAHREEAQREAGPRLGREGQPVAGLARRAPWARDGTGARRPAPARWPGTGRSAGRARCLDPGRRRCPPWPA